MFGEAKHMHIGETPKQLLMYLYLYLIIPSIIVRIYTLTGTVFLEPVS